MDSNNAADNAQKPAVTLSSEQAEIILKADLRNITKKVQAGKPLSASERNLFQSVLSVGGTPSSVSFVQNQVELAEILGVDRKTIQRHRKIPGNPGVQADGRWDVNAWRIWLSERRGIADEDGLSQTQLRARQILLQNQKLEFQLAVLRKEFVSAADVEKWAADMALKAKKVLLAIPSSLAPQVVGVSVPEAELRIREAINEALQQLHTRPLAE